MRILLLCFFISLSCFSLSQNIETSEAGMQDFAFTFLDTIINTGKSYKSDRKLVFKKIDPMNDTIHLGNKILDISDYLTLSIRDSSDYFILFNSGSKTIRIVPQDGVLMTVKEAINSKGFWRPIEFFYLSMCGNSYLNEHELKNGQFAVMITGRHFGEMECWQRLRLKTETYGILISEPYKGSINQLEFFPKEIDAYQLRKGRLSYLNE